MTRFSASLIADVRTQLEAWFAAELPRGHRVSRYELIVDEAAAQLAALLYKRNGIVIDGVQPLPLPSTRPEDTHVLTFTTWTQFLKQPELATCTAIVDDTLLRTHSFPNLLNTVFQSVQPLTCTEFDKNLETVFRLANTIPESTQTIVSMGGGIASDIAGCVAALVNKPLVVVPTTWLAGVDAAIGGKNGVNHPVYGKNQIGLFLNPIQFCLVDEAFKTLPRAQFLCGFAEALKHRWLAGDFDLANMAHLNTTPRPSSWLHPHINFKRCLVARDPFEHNVRRALNFGHTYAHVIEALGDDGVLTRLPHGAAVALGMFLKTREMPSAAAGDFFDTLEKTVSELLSYFPLKVLQPIDKQRVIQIFRADKKRQRDTIPIVTPAYGLFSQDITNDAIFITEMPAHDASQKLIGFLKSLADIPNL